MLQATALRLKGLAGALDSCLVVSNENHRFAVAEQIAAIEMSAQIILEPEGRNTAPAVALAALHAMAEGEDPVLLIMAADHVIKDIAAFQASVANGVVAAEAGKLVTFGIVPTKPETGYGYVRARADGAMPVPVEAFVEKPDEATAISYIEDGNYFWNSGMFLFRASAYMDELGKQVPAMLEACRRSMATRTLDGAFVRPDAATFLSCPSDSIDYAVMEKSKNSVMVPLDAGWSDVGSWSALQDVTERDEDGNSLDGDVLVHDCVGTYIQAESRLVAAVGLQDVIVVETKDCVLIADKSRSQDVKEIVEQLRKSGRGEMHWHRQVFRPWGSYDGIENGEQFQVKRLIIKSGASLSLQKHAHRSEHWVVVCGKIRVTRNDEEFDLGVNESTYVAIGDIHRIVNPFDEDAEVIEVQCGEYLGEDDIVRLEDNYGRQGTDT
jgi:mannose-1-phosphate guanylyltransferase/mannose-6-phosphate isomerase